MLALEILTGPIAVVLAAYAVGMIALAFAIQPLRMKLVETIDEMVAEPGWSDSDREQLFTLRDYNMSFLVGLLLPVAAIGAIADTILNGEKAEEPKGLDADPRYAQCVWRFFASVAAANPIAAIVSIVLMIVLLVISLAFKHKSPRTLVDEAVEEPTLRALGRVAAIA